MSSNKNLIKKAGNIKRHPMQPSLKFNIYFLQMKIRFKSMRKSKSFNYSLSKLHYLLIQIITLKTMTI